MNISNVEKDWEIIKYNLNLSFHEANINDFQGNCLIIIKNNQNFLNSIQLDSYELKINKIQIQQNGKIKNCKFIEDSSNKKINLLFFEPMLQGKITIQISYKGKIREDGLGIYKCLTNSENILIITHFEPYFASLCFPCLTDVSIRFIYSLCITFYHSKQNEKHNNNFNIISCMPLLKKDYNILSNFSIFYFEDTPTIPSYLLAFAIGKFNCIETSFFSITTKNIPIRLFIPIGFYNSAKENILKEIIMNAIQMSLKSLEQYFDFNFWLPKLDFIVIPYMLLAGMEHIGCCFLHVIPNDSNFINNLPQVFFFKKKIS